MSAMARLIRVAAVSHVPAKCAEGGRTDFAALREVVHAVAKDKPQVICFPEICASCGQDFAAGVKHAPELGPFVMEIGRLAREVKAALVVPTLERRGGRVYNSAPVVDAAGRLAMVYRKNFPTVGEMDLGVHPDTEVPVADCDGVRVGAAICFDINFARVAAALERQRAKIVFFPSMFLAGRLARAWALRYGFYVVVAHAGESAVIDMDGRYLVRQGRDTPQARRDLLPPWALAEVDVDRELIHLDYNQEKFGRVRERYGPDVVIEPHNPEAFAYLSTRRPDLSVEQVMREFELETAAAYFARSARHRESVLASFAEHPSPPPPPRAAGR